MRQDPGIDVGALAACLAREDGLEAASLTFLPLGHDMSAAAYELVTRDGRRFFVKVRFGPVDEAALLVPRALLDRGVPPILAPLRSRSAALRRPLDGASVVPYPFVEGESATGEAVLAMSFFAPGGDLDRVETVVLPKGASR